MPYFDNATTTTQNYRHFSKIIRASSNIDNVAIISILQN